VLQQLPEYLSKTSNDYKGRHQHHSPPTTVDNMHPHVRKRLLLAFEPRISARLLGSSAPASSKASTQSWSEEWKTKGLGAGLPKPGSSLTNLLFVQMGFGVDQHGNDDVKHGGSGQGATKAALRAVRNAIEVRSNINQLLVTVHKLTFNFSNIYLLLQFNSIPGIVEAVPGGRKEMLIHLKLGVPTRRGSDEPMEINLNDVAKVFPYGRLLPIDVVVGGLSFHTGRIVRELGDVDDIAVCVAACVSIGYDSGERDVNGSDTVHKRRDTTKRV